MKKLIKQALQAAGYTGPGSEPTVGNLIECFLDYADAYGGDIDDLREQIADGDITIEMMCRALIRCN